MDRIHELLEKGLGELTPEELEELQDAVLTEAASLEDANTTPEVVAALNELADTGEKVNTEKVARAEAAKQAEADRKAAADRIAGLKGDTEDEVDGEADADADAASETDDEDEDAKAKAKAAAEEAEAEAEEVPAEAVAASGKGRVRRLARTGSRPEPGPERSDADEVGRTVVTASGALRGVDPNKPIEGKYDLARAMCATLKRMNRNSVGRGDVLLASATWDYPEDRTFTADPDHNAELVDAVTTPSAIIASGGVCAPVNVDYTVNTWATAERPLKEKLASFQASRGGLRYVTPPDQSALAEATSVWTEATDAEPGEATKPVLHISCGEEQVVYVDAVPTRLGFGNMQGQFAPEWVAANTDLAIAAAARVAEDNLLSHLEALSVKDITQAKAIGATRDLITTINQICTAYRWIHRISRSVRLTAVFPDFVKDIIRVDLSRGPGYDNSPRDLLAITDAEVEALLVAHGLNPIFHLDGQAEPEGGAYPLQGYASTAIKTETATPVFPKKIVWYLFVEGSIQFLDGGRLDLGVVRDSTLDATNDYETFVETFEGLANRGFTGAVLQNVTELCADGGSVAPAAYTTCA